MLRVYRRYRFAAFQEVRFPSSCHWNSSSSLPSISSLFQSRRFSPAARFAEYPVEKSKRNVQQSLSGFFQEAVGLSKKKGGNNAVKSEGDAEILKLKERLKKLEEQVRILNKERREEGKNSNPPSVKGTSTEKTREKHRLVALFTDEKKTKKVRSVDPIGLGNKAPVFRKPLASNVMLFAHHLHSKGYLKDANFIGKKQLDSAVFEAEYAREFLKSSAVKFGHDHPEIARWLSASDLKKLALFGCPSSDRRSAYAAKYLRTAFNIEEHEVCPKCPLRNSCKHANRKPRKGPKKLQLATVMRLVTVYGLDLSPQQLIVPEEIQDSVNQLLKEIVDLSSNKS